MTPIIAIIGRPNVGKSTLFNRLTGTRDALVADQAGLTRDRHVGRLKGAGRDALVVDTGGLGEDADVLVDYVEQQAMQAAREADLLLFVVDAQAGLLAADEEIAARLRGMGKPLLLVVNKSEGVQPDVAGAEFHGLGLGDPRCISAEHGHGTRQLIDTVAAALPAMPTDDAGEDVIDPGKRIRVTVLGRPNVGKSTLINRMLGEERVLVSDLAGTTRDSIEVPFSRDGIDYTLVDTAGVRRRARVADHIEKLSVMKTLQSLTRAHVAIVLLDAHEGIGEQDMRLLGYAIERGCGLIIGVNKWDGLQTDERDRIRAELERRLSFAHYAPVKFVSAMHGSGVGDLFPLVVRVHAGAFPKVTTNALNDILMRAVDRHQPPMVRGQRIKLRYAHLGGANPPTIIIHGSRVAALPGAYTRYLERCFRDALDLVGNPVRIEVRQGENPFKGRKNKLTPRQVTRRKRIISHARGRGR